MSWKPKMTCSKQAAEGNAGATRRCLMLVSALALLPIAPAIAQSGDQQEKGDSNRKTGNVEGGEETVAREVAYRCQEIVADKHGGEVG